MCGCVLDEGYGKRSYGTKYDTSSFVGIIRGEAKKKVFHFKVMNKNCSIRRCNEGVPHKCFINHVSLSNGIEAGAVACEFDESIKHQVIMINITTDGDCKMFQKAKLNVLLNTAHCF